MEAHILKIDLSKKSFKVETIPSKIIRQYIGGRGLGVYLLYTLVPPKIDPLSEKNHLIFTAGPANGTDLFFSSKTILTTKSPLTNIYLYSVSSGTFSHQIRRAGFWAIDIEGISDSPVYIAVNNQNVEFRDASPLLGLESGDTQQGMLRELDLNNAGTVAIGPAGEKLIKYACILSEGHFYRSFARGGAGCVMGSKKLKGIVISGDEEVAVGDEEGFRAVKKCIVEKRRTKEEFAKRWCQYGTGADLQTMNALGIIPTRNWKGGQFEDWAEICTATNAEKWPRKNRACGPYCITPCSHYIEIKEGPYQGAHSDGPEWETIYAFGSCCGIEKFDAIIAANQVCDEHGIDTMSAGVTIGFAMECFEKGLIDYKDTDGIELRFGNDEAMIVMLKKIVNQEGFGQRLANGTKKLSEEIKGSEAFAMHAKGLELGGYECRGLMGQALQFAISNRGGCHHACGLPARIEATDGTRMLVEGKGKLVKNSAIDRSIRDSIPACTFVGWLLDFETIGKIVSALFGETYTTEDLKRVGMRIISLERLFNMREGITRRDDTLPARLLNEPKPDGPTKGAVVPLEELKDDYYRAMGWDLITGNPPDSLIAELEIPK
ncbi:aldehyde ferredoxin oxidoreductase family protein [Chloroflexota bacterium]